MVYLVITELSTVAEDVIMVTSSIMKDMQPNLEVVYRPNAIRALARIIDVSGTTTTTRRRSDRLGGNVYPIPYHASHNPCNPSKDSSRQPSSTETPR